jgi:MscS family membrane protein
MRWQFKTWFRLYLAVLAMVLCWSLWAGAQPAATPPATATNLPAVGTNTLAKALIKLPMHYETFGLDRVDFLRDNEVLEQPLWKYLASLIYIVLAFYVAKFLDYFVNVWLKRLAAKTETQYDDLLLQLLRGPVKVVAFVIFLNIGLGIFDWPLRAQAYLSKAFIIVVAFSVTYLLLKVVDLLLGLWREKVATPQDKLFAEHLFPVIRKSAKVALGAAAVVLTADNLGIRVTSLLAGLSIGGLALGLAAQDTVANLFGAVSIFLDKPFHLGDLIRVEGVEGVVESIGLRSTQVRNADGHHVTIPNKTMGNAIITNITRRPTIRTEMNLGLTYDTPVDRVQRATALLEEIFRAHPQTADLIVSFNRFGDSALNLQVVHVWKGTQVKLHAAAMQQLNLEVKRRFDAEKIEFAFPTQTLYLKPEPGK